MAQKSNARRKTRIKKLSDLTKDTLLTVILVVKNDENIIKDVITETSQTLTQYFPFHEILIIDNGSIDNTRKIILGLQKRLPNIRLLVLSRSYDLEIAFAAALENCIGDYVVLMDIVHDPPNFIPSLFAKATEGYDIVIAERKSRKENNLFEKISAKLFYWLSSSLLGYHFSPNASYFRILSRRAVNSIVQIRNKNRYLKYFNALVGFNQTFIPYDRVYRRTPETSKKRFVASLSFALNVIFSNSTLPLRLATYLGVLASFLNLLFLVYIFLVALIKRRVAEGWISTSVVTATMFFLLFLLLTIMAEYISRILNETKDQPLYFIAEEHNSNVTSKKTKRLNVV